MITIRIKTPLEKKLGLSNFAPSLHCLLSLAFSRRAFLCVEVPSIGGPAQPLYRKMRESQLLSTSPGIDPSPLEVDERTPYRCTTSAPLHYDGIVLHSR